MAILKIRDHPRRLDNVKGYRGFRNAITRLPCSLKARQLRRLKRLGRAVPSPQKQHRSRPLSRKPAMGARYLRDRPKIISRSLLPLPVKIKLGRVMEISSRLVPTRFNLVSKKIFPQLKKNAAATALRKSLISNNDAMQKILTDILTEMSTGKNANPMSREHAAVLEHLDKQLKPTPSKVPGVSLTGFSHVRYFD